MFVSPKQEHGTMEENVFSKSKFNLKQQLHMISYILSALHYKKQSVLQKHETSVGSGVGT